MPTLYDIPLRQLVGGVVPPQPVIESCFKGYVTVFIGSFQGQGIILLLYNK